MASRRGLTPLEYLTGGELRSGGISKRGSTSGIAAFSRPALEAKGPRISKYVQ